MYYCVLLLENGLYEILIFHRVEGFRGYHSPPAPWKPLEIF